MNLFPTLADKLGAISVIGTLICLPLLIWLTKRNDQKKAMTMREAYRQGREKYMKSSEHAGCIAMQISSQKHEWIRSECGKKWLEGETEAVRDHVFSDTIVFKEEGLIARIVAKNAQSIVGIIYEEGSEAFAREVARILVSDYSTQVAFINKSDSTQDNGPKPLNQ